MGQITHPTLGSPMAMVTPNAELYVTNYSDGIGPATLDKSTHATNMIDYEHHEIHDGSHYFTRGWTTIGNSGIPLYFSLTTPTGSKWLHLIFSVNADNLIEMKEFEGATISGGTTVNYFNSNRNSTKTSLVNIKSNPVISGAIPTSGTLLATTRFGLAGVNPNQQGIIGEHGRSNELILKSGTTYLWEFKPGGNTVIFNWVANWYEHTDKTQQF